MGRLLVRATTGRGESSMRRLKWAAKKGGGGGVRMRLDNFTAVLNGAEDEAFGAACAKGDGVGSHSSS